MNDVATRYAEFRASIDSNLPKPSMAGGKNSSSLISKQKWNEAIHAQNEKEKKLADAKRTARNRRAKKYYWEQPEYFRRKANRAYHKNKSK